VTEYLLTLAVSFVSAVVPVVNLEAYLGGLAVLVDNGTIWVTLAIGAIAAVGQMAGKMLYYFAGRGALQLPKRLQRHARIAQDDEAVIVSAVKKKPSKLAGLLRWRERMERRPATAVGVVAVSASVGLPPFAVISALAGVVRVPVASFVVVGLLGRWLRFAVLLGAVGAAAT